MSGEWKRYKTSELIGSGLLAIGDGYRATNSELDKDGIPFARAGNINDGFKFEGADLLGHNSVKKAGEKVSRPGDVVFTSKGTVGRFAFVGVETPQFVYSPQLCYWRSKNQEELDPRFLFYWLKGPASWSQISWAKGQTDMADYVSLRDQREAFWIDIPPPFIQRKIVEILGSIDDKIALNRQINQTLEAMAQALFKSWFVDFEPVRTKIAAIETGEDPTLAAMRTISGKTDDELAHWQTTDPDAYNHLHTTASLFPKALVESELGLVPEGWEVVRVDKILEFAYGKALKSTERIAGEVPVYGSGGITGYHNQALIAGPGIIIGRKGTVGSIYYENNNFFPIDTVFYVIPKSSIPLSFCLHVLLNLGLENMNTDAAVPGLNRNNVYRLLVIQPTNEILSEFSNQLDAWMESQTALLRENHTLATLRDTLLPKLLSGELTISEIVSAESQLELFAL